MINSDALIKVRFLTPQEGGGEITILSEIQNAKQYVDETKKFMTNPPKGTLTKTRNNGDNILYNEKSNTFGVMTEDGTPKTMFKPDPAEHGYKTNLEYFNAQ